MQGSFLLKDQVFRGVFQKMPLENFAQLNVRSRYIRFPTDITNKFHNSDWISVEIDQQRWEFFNPLFPRGGGHFRNFQIGVSRKRSSTLTLFKGWSKQKNNLFKDWEPQKPYPILLHITMYPIYRSDPAPLPKAFYKVVLSLSTLLHIYVYVPGLYKIYHLQI